ncbi:MAG: tRNA1(Val) (adenine(37)-N6)-methyltransferase [Bacteroidota bacterium]
MSNKPFAFKQFSVEQDRCAMKIGTDGILLGAWANLKDPYSILDIGAGTGIIGLMMAQRSNAGLIDALEIDEDAYEQCVDNFENSNWGDRLFCYHASLDEFAEELQDEEKYDLIISNPPFYSPNLNDEEISAARKKARFYDAMPFEELVESASKLLSDDGEFAVILPFYEEVNFLRIAKSFNLFPNLITRVRGMENTPLKRSLLQLSFSEVKVQESELTIEISRHQYTEEYKELVKDFYLKM